MCDDGLCEKERYRITYSDAGGPGSCQERDSCPVLLAGAELVLTAYTLPVSDIDSLGGFDTQLVTGPAISRESEFHFQKYRFDSSAFSTQNPIIQVSFTK